MRTHLVAETGLMLAATAGPEQLQAGPGKAPIPLHEYRVSRRPGRSARLWQLLHILARPFSLALSAWFVQRFNACLRAEWPGAQSPLAGIEAGDRVLWFNPSAAVQSVVDQLIAAGHRLDLYFVDPVHRLGLAPQTLARWRRYAGLHSYSEQEAQAHGMNFLVPYLPAAPPRAARPEFDLVYVGSPSPGRLAWVIVLQALVRRHGGKAYLRLATRHPGLARAWPAVFVPRVSFEDYTALAARSLAILELHERDAEGVTLRATLCQAQQLLHLCNLKTCEETWQVQLRNSAQWLPALIRLRQGEPGLHRPPQLDALPLRSWLQRHFA